MKLDFTESDHSTVIVEKALKQSYQLGIAEGLRMAAEIAEGAGLYDSGLITRNDICNAIRAKAKEIERECEIK